jgi:hypothetical protein
MSAPCLIIDKDFQRKGRVPPDVLLRLMKLRRYMPHMHGSLRLARPIVIPVRAPFVMPWTVK